MILEICADSVTSVKAACEGGADRIELCADLIIGGTTPGYGLAKKAREAADIPIRALIRPRFGDFCYDDEAFKVMLEDIRLFREMGINGVVTGVLKPDGCLDMERMKRLKEAAGDMDFAVHRAFDVSKDPFRSLKEAIDLGAATLLTSGQAPTAWEGRELLARLNAEGGDKIQIMAGSGVSEANIRDLARATGLTAFHMSGKKETQGAMAFKRTGIPMGLPGFDEYTILRTDAEAVKAAANVIKSL